MASAEFSRRVENVVGYPPLWRWATSSVESCMRRHSTRRLSRICPESCRRRFSRPREPAEDAARVGQLALVQRSLVSQPPGDGGQRLIACPLLDAALELCQGCRCCTSWMPNDPHDLANTPAPTASCRRPAWEGRALAVSAAAVTDHVCDSWHRESTPNPDFRGRGAARRQRPGIHAISALTDRRKPGRWLSVETHGERRRDGGRDARRRTAPVRRKQQRAHARRADGKGTGRRAVRPFATPKCGSRVASWWPFLPTAPEHPRRKTSHRSPAGRKEGCHAPGPQDQAEEAAGL
jgi:hypothetical protein